MIENLGAEHWLAIFFGTLALGQAAYWAFGKWRRRWRARRRSRAAIQGEKDAERLVESEGFEILQRQAKTTWRVSVDGRPLELDLRADLLLRRGSKRYVADVKTGSRAPKLTTAATRRQLLEYRCAYDVDGVLLIDMATETVHTVDFHVPRRHKSEWMRFILIAAVAFALGAGLGAALTAG